MRTEPDIGRFVAALAILLAIAASIYLIRGAYVAIGGYGGYDLQTRATEYHFFAAGVYPNSHLATNSLPGEALPNSVYPPYAFPLFAPFFVAESEIAVRLTFVAFSLLALLAVGAFGYREFAFAGRQAQALGAIASLAIAHNSSAIAIGQFSIICMGLVVLQLECLRRGKVMTAGLCWALAMIKPQIGIAFMLPFMMENRRRGLLVGLVLLGGLSLFACFYTGVSPLAVLNYWLWGESYDFIAGGNSRGSSTGSLLAVWGTSPRFALAWSVLAAALIVATVWWRAQLQSMSVLTLVAVCAIVGRVFIPHRAYDNIMLFPALLAFLMLALARPSVKSFAWAGLFGVSVWIPWTSLERAAWLDAALLAFWSAAAVVLIRENLSPKASAHNTT